MKAIILAAGEGQRLRPYTNDRPKSMVEVNGVSLLDRQIRIIKSCGIDEIIILGGYKSDMLEGKGSNLILNPRYYETNMVWTLFCGEEFLHGDVIISYGDIVYSPKILSELLKCDAEISVAIDMNWEKYWRERNDDPLDDAETLILRPDNQIKEIGQKPKSIKEVQGQYMGLMKFSGKGIDSLRSTFFNCKEVDSIMGKSPECAYMTDLLMQLIKEGQFVRSVPVTDTWVEVDTVFDLSADYTRRRIEEIDASLLGY